MIRYLICLTIGPAFFSASIYLCLSRLVVVYGENLSRFRPRTYTITFVCCDITSLVLQAIGGGIASTADIKSTEQEGINIMIAGLSFQVASLVLFILLCAEFAWNVYRAQGAWEPMFEPLRQTKRFTAFLWGTLNIFFFFRWVQPLTCLSSIGRSNHHHPHPICISCRGVESRVQWRTCQPAGYIYDSRRPNDHYCHGISDGLSSWLVIWGNVVSSKLQTGKSCQV